MKSFFALLSTVVSAAVLPAVMGAPAPLLSSIEASDFVSTSPWGDVPTDLVKASRTGDKSFVEYTVHVALDQPEDHTIGAGVTQVHPSVTQFITWLQNPANFPALQRQAICFYSGYTDKVRAYERIDAFGAAVGCTSMHAILRAAGVNQQTYDAWTLEDWAAASGAMGAYTRNSKSFVLLGKTVAADSIWYRNEWPALQSNALVKTVDQYTLQTTGAWVFDRRIKGTPFADTEAEVYESHLGLSSLIRGLLKELYVQ